MKVRIVIAVIFSRVVKRTSLCWESAKWVLWLDSNFNFMTIGVVKRVSRIVINECIGHLMNSTSSSHYLLQDIMYLINIIVKLIQYTNLSDNDHLSIHPNTDSCNVLPYCCTIHHVGRDCPSSIHLCLKRILHSIKLSITHCVMHVWNW